MPTQSRCAECGSKYRLNNEPFYDIRTPPIKNVPCLCRDCGEGFANEAIEEAEDELSELRKKRDQIIRG